MQKIHGIEFYPLVGFEGWFIAGVVVHDFMYMALLKGDTLYAFDENWDLKDRIATGDEAIKGSLSFVSAEFYNNQEASDFIIPDHVKRLLNT